MFTDEMVTLGLLAQLPGPFHRPHGTSTRLPLLSLFLSTVESLVLFKPQWVGPWASAPPPLHVLSLALWAGHVSGPADTPDSCQHLQLILGNFPRARNV